jgi:hypothetical protein
VFTAPYSIDRFINVTLLTDPSTLLLDSLSFVNRAPSIHCFIDHNPSTFLQDPLSVFLHQRGINMRLLGRVYETVEADLASKVSNSSTATGCNRHNCSNSSCSHALQDTYAAASPRNRHS